MEQNNFTQQQERQIELSLPPKEQEATSATTSFLLSQPLSMTDTALIYVKNGLSVIPIGSDKQPSIKSWKPFQSKSANVSEILSWWQTPNLSIAIICGQGSGNLEGIDFDEKYNIDSTRLFDQWSSLVEKEMPGFVRKLVVQKTMNDGDHCLYRCNTIERNQKLAQRGATADELKSKPDEKNKTLIETRGIGGYLLCYPSRGYAIRNGDLRSIPTIRIEERAVLISCARALNQLVDEKKIVREKKSKQAGNRPGDQFDREGDHKALLEKHGWTYVANVKNREYWRRPGKAEGVSATFDPAERLFYNFSSNSPNLNEDRFYTLFALYTYLEANGDFSEAAKELSKQGYGDPITTEGNLLKVEGFLRGRYEFRLNVIKEKVEFRRIGTTTYSEMRDVDLNSLHLELIRNKLEIGFEAFNRLLFSDFVEEYDPIASYFEGLQAWDGVTDYIDQLAHSITLKDSKQNEQWKTCLERWLIGYAACALDPEIVNQTAIILVGQQGIGKSRWLNRLVPDVLSKYRFVGTINPENKDTLVYLSECMLINLDELETLKKAEIGALKTIMTLPVVKVRRPYGRLAEDLVRRASFVGSINHTEFLNDPTGFRRFLTFEVASIDFDKMPDMDLALEQAFVLYRAGESWWFDQKEIVDINERNKQYSIASYEEELLLETMTKPEEKEGKFDNLWKTATKIAEDIHALNNGFKVDDKSVRNLGYALTKHGYQYKKTNGTKMYFIKWK